MGKLPPEHATILATATDEKSQPSSIPPSTNGCTAADAEDWQRADSTLAELASKDIPNSASEAFDAAPRPPKRERSGNGINQASRSSSQSSLPPNNGQPPLRTNTQGSSSFGSITGIFNNIRTLGQGSPSQQKEAIGGGQKQYPLSQRFYKMEQRIGEGASATVCDVNRRICVHYCEHTRFICSVLLLLSLSLP